MRRRLTTTLAAALAAAVAAVLGRRGVAAGCASRADCRARGGTCVWRWNPAVRYDARVRRWVGGWDHECREALR